VDLAIGGKGRTGTAPPALPTAQNAPSNMESGSWQIHDVNRGHSGVMNYGYQTQHATESIGQLIGSVHKP
jgi:hypothetical protein